MAKLDKEMFDKIGFAPGCATHVPISNKVAKILKRKKGDAVIIHSMKVGGEIVNTEREDGMIEVKVAMMHVDGSGVKRKIENVLAKENDLSLITKKHGVVII